MQSRLSSITDLSPSFAAAVRGYRRATAAGDKASADALLSWVAGQPNVGGKAIREAGLRVEVDSRTEKVGRKVRDAEVEKVPIMLVVGRREAEAGQVSVRRHGLGDQGVVSVDEFVASALEEVRGLGIPV